MIYIETLGCPKNLTDSEDFLKYAPGKLISAPDKADVIVLNTCAFIDDAVEESVNRMLEFAAWKQENPKIKLIVMGCLVNRYGKEYLKKSVPEVDYWLFTDEREGIFRDDLFESKRRQETTSGKLNPDYYRYLKISEGCNNLCSYCMIPKIRGPLRSRAMDYILQDFDDMVNEENPPKEIMIIAQDISKYGTEIAQSKRKLTDLLMEMEKRDYQGWIRLLYCNPDKIDDELISVMKNSKKIIPYLDMPIQHVSDKVLKLMNRKYTKRDIISVYEKLKKEVPEIVLRTTVIVGFPGETDKRFEELLDFFHDYPFDKCGAFRYQKQEGTAACLLKNTNVPRRTAEERLAVFMGLQGENSSEQLKRWINKEFPCIIEEIKEEGDFPIIGRTYHDAPEIDGITYIKSIPEGKSVGDIVNVKILETDTYDMRGECAEK